MKLLQITSNDLAGSRFNGLGIRSSLKDEGIHSTHLVWCRTCDDPDVRLAYDYPGSRFLTGVLNSLEYRLSLQSMLHFQWFSLPALKEFREADLVHLHLIHDGGYFSLAALPWLSRFKPLVWTLHDPWAMTGHCTYPLTCTRWQMGCRPCPQVKLCIPLKDDLAFRNFKLKQLIYQHCDLDLVVASRWMEDFVVRSPLMTGFRVHRIPFGVDLERFKPRPAEAARNRLGVFKDHAVICLRAFDSPFKGLDYFRQALRRLALDYPICLLTFHEKGNLDEFIGKCQIIEFGWTDDEDLMIDAYSASDFFVMPSTAEAFGLMAIEAMACGKPTLSFEGTSLPEVIFSPKAGLAVPMGDAEALAGIMERWIRDPEERQARGERSRELAIRHYDVRLFVSRLANLYRSVWDRSCSGKRPSKP